MHQILLSKKFQAATAATIVGLLAKFNLQVDTETVLVLIVPLIAYVVSQGIADHGKERAKEIVRAIESSTEEVAEVAAEVAEGELLP